MFSNVIHQVEIDSILIDRPLRQRSVVTPESVLSLAVSIAKSQWISPILIDEDTHYLIAGERRLMSVKVLRAAMKGDYSAFADPASAREVLFPVCTCQRDCWKQWNKIPAQLGKDFTPTDLMMFEFIENAHRQDLPWQDKAKAIYGVHCQGLSSEEAWTATHTANILGIGIKTVQEYLRVWRVYCDEEANPAVKSIIEESPTIRSAAQSLERYTSRRETGHGVSLISGGITTPKPKLETSLKTKPGPAKGTDVYLSEARELGLEPDDDDDDCFDDTPSDHAAKLLLNADFIQWADHYSGEPFNFLHCDFPYGIDFNTGDYTSRIGDKVPGDYDDSADTYWKLLETLYTNKSQLIAPQAHVMFWFSQNLRRETEDFFKQMGGFVQPFLMVWHCEESGIIPDPQRYGRRTYETAMLVTFGDRKIIAPRALSIASSRNTKTRIHRSQKPIGVLEHFFGMFVDDSSVMLDPTAGSGTSLIVAENLNARRVVGLEMDEEIYKNSCAYINNLLGEISL